MSANNLTLERRSFYFAFLREIGDFTIRAVQLYFRDNPGVPTEWRWQSVVQTKSDGNTCEVTAPTSPIHIGAEHGEQIETYPSILLSDIMIDINDLWLGQKQGSLVVPNPQFSYGTAPEYEDNIPRLNPQYLEVGERIGGQLTAQVTLKVRGNTKPERDEVTDILLRGFVSPIRRSLYQRALNWVPNRGKVGSEATEPLTNARIVHVRAFSFALQAEWYEDFYYQAVTVEDVTCIPTMITTAPSVG